MRRIIGGIIGVGVVIGLGGSALAADLPPSPPPRAPAVYVPAVLPIYNWAGIYVGVNGGWGWGNAKWTADAVGGFLGSTGSVHDNGGVVGGTLGANFQAGAFVFGVEGDWDYSAINTGTNPASAPLAAIARPATIGWRQRAAAPATAPIVSCSTPPQAAPSPMCRRISTARPPATPSPAGPPAAASSGPFADNWTAKVEYLYVNLGNTSVNCVNAVCTAVSSLSVTGVPPGPAIPVSIGLTENLIRAGVNYKFSW